MKRKHFIFSLFLIISLLINNKSFAADSIQQCDGHHWGYIKQITVGTWDFKNAGIVLYNTNNDKDSGYLFNYKTTDTPEGRALLSLEELAYSSGAMVSAYCTDGYLTSLYIVPDDYNGK